MADSNDLERARAKHRALLNARLQLKQAFERIDYRFDVIKPSIKQLEQDAARGQLPEYGTEIDS